MLEIPDRSGWLSEPLASAPPVPPFPELTDLESRALEIIAGSLGPVADDFRRQVKACQVTDRVDTKVGFYTRIVVDRTVAPPFATAWHVGVHLEVKGTRYGMAFMPRDEDGYLATIEGVTYGEDDLAGQDLAALEFGGYQLI